MPRKIRPYDLPRQIFVFMLLGALICIGSVFYTYQQVSHKINENAAADSRDRVQERLASLQTQVRMFSKDYNNWSAVYEASMMGDVKFIADNYGITAIEGKIFDFVVLFGGPIPSPLSWVENGSRNPGGIILDPNTIDAAHEALRSRKEVRPSIDFFAYDGENLAMVTATYLLPDSEQAVNSNTVVTAPVALIGRHLSRADLAAIEQGVGVQDLHIAPDDKNSLISLSLHDVKGQEIAHLAWRPSRPGSAMTRQLAPVVAILSLAFAALAGLATWLVYKNARYLVLREVESRDLARTDALTCLPNRLAFNEMIHGNAVGDFAEVALVMIDLDRLKQTNDVFGHAAGDYLLKDFAEKLALCKDAWTFVARLGGDEFCALVHGRGAVERARALVSILDVRCAKPVEVRGETVQLDFSAGIAAHVPGVDIDETIHKADLALRRSKSDLQERIGVYNTDMDLEDKSALLLQQVLRRALRAPDEFFVFYQPIVPASVQDAGLLEALARWKSPILGTVTPDRFIRAAEEMGVITELGWIIMDKIIGDLASNPSMRVSINVSPLQMMKPDFVSKLIRRLDFAGVASDRIQIELTEHVLVRNQQAILDRIEHIRSADIKVALDDFGTGFSAISYLTATKFDSIKIDGSLVRSSVVSEDRANFFHSVVSLCRSVCSNVVVEGIETAAQEMEARNAGADAFQGYLFGRPASLVDCNLAQTPDDARMMWTSSKGTKIIPANHDLTPSSQAAATALG